MTKILDKQEQKPTSSNGSVSSIKHNRKLIFIVLLIILLLFGGVFAVYLNKIGNEKTLIPSPLPTQPTTNPTSNWKTFTNQKYGFSFKYPGNLYIRNDSTDNFIGFLLNQDENQSQKLVVQVENNPSNLSIKNYSEKNKPIPDDRINPGYTEIKINNYEGLTLRYEKPCLGICERVKVEKHFAKYLKGDKFIVGFSVDATNPEGNALEDEQWLDQILTTFRFIE